MSNSASHGLPQRQWQSTMETDLNVFKDIVLFVVPVKVVFKDGHEPRNQWFTTIRGSCWGEPTTVPSPSPCHNCLPTLSCSHHHPDRQQVSGPIVSVQAPAAQLTGRHMSTCSRTNLRTWPCCCFAGVRCSACYQSGVAVVAAKGATVEDTVTSAWSQDRELTGSGRTVGRASPFAKQNTMSRWKKFWASFYFSKTEFANQTRTISVWGLCLGTWYGSCPSLVFIYFLHSCISSPDSLYCSCYLDLALIIIKFLKIACCK